MTQRHAHLAQEDNFSNCPAQILIPFGYDVPGECRKSEVGFDPMAPFAPATPTQTNKCCNHEKIKKKVKYREKETENINL